MTHRPTSVNTSLADNTNVGSNMGKGAIICSFSELGGRVVVHLPYGVFPSRRGVEDFFLC